MRRKIIIRFGLFLLVFSLIFTMASCDLDDSKAGTPDNDDNDDFLVEADIDTDIQMPDHYHLYELMIITPPSCGVEGVQAYMCVICGMLQHQSSIAALPHNYKRSDILSAYPTCTTSGKEVYYCSTCGCTQEEIQKAKGHKWRTKITTDSNTNEIIITPYCTVCQFSSTSEYRYKIDGVKKLIYKNGQIAEYGGHKFSGDIIIEYYLQAPYYAVYCSDRYLLIVRNAERLSWCSELTSSESARGYYTGLGCTIVYEANISITADGRIQILK